MAKAKAASQAARALEKQAKAQEKLNRAEAKTKAKNHQLGLERQASAKSSAMGMLGMGAAGAALAAVGLGAAGFSAMAGMSMDLGMQIGQAQEFKNSTLFAFETITKTKKGAAEAYKMAQKTALDTGADYQESIGSMNALMAQGFSVKESDTLVRQMSDLATINPKANLEGITRAIGQMRNKGKSSAEEMLQLSEAGLSVGEVYKQIGKDMGLVEGKKNKKGQAQSIVDQVLDLQKTGKISSDVAIAAIQKTIKAQTGNKDPGQLAAEKADKSMTGALMRAQSMKQMFLESVNIDWTPITGALTKIQNVMSGPAGEKFSKALSDGFNRMLAVLDGISEKDIADTVTAMGDAFSTFSRIVANTAEFTMDCVRAFNATNEAIKALSGGSMNIFDAIWVGFKATLSAMTGGLYGLVEMVYDNWGKIVGAFEWVGSALQSVNSTIGGFFAGIGSTIAGYAATVYETVSGIGTNMVDGIVGGINGGAAGIVDALVGAVESAVDAAEEALGIQSPSKVLRASGRWASKGMELGIRDGAPDVAMAGAEMGAGAARAAQAFSSSTNNSNTNNSKTINVNMSQKNYGGSPEAQSRAFANAARTMAMTAG